MNLRVEDALSTDILALHVFEKYLLIGEGSYLQLYLINENYLIPKFKVFSGAAIHGVKKWNSSEDKISCKFLVWGQKSFAFLSFDAKNLVWEKLSQEIHIEDWIADVACSKDELSIIVLTAHNSLIHYAVPPLLEDFAKRRRENEEEECSSPLAYISYPKVHILKRQECTKNSLLYCGLVTGDAWNACVALSGTVFGIIHVWAPWVSLDSVEAIPPILSLSGPKGAIFSITYDANLKLIAATADDRSIRVWKVTFEKDLDSSSSSGYQNDWLTCRIEEIFCSFGHTARVWKSLILEDKTFLSCGEDSSVCHWSECGSLLCSWVVHPSSNVWCMACSQDSFFTGGSDGAVKRWSKERRKPERITTISLPFMNEVEKESMKDSGVKTCFPPSKKGSKKNFIRSVNLVDADTCVMVSNDGCLWVYESVRQTTKLVFQQSCLKGYIVSAVNNDSTLLALGTLNGNILIFNTDTWDCLCQQAVSQSKIQSVLFIERSEVASCSAGGKIQIWTVLEDDLELVREHTLPPCRQPWITAALFMKKEQEKRFYLLVGDPSGSVHLYAPNSSLPVSSLRGIHGRNGVTCLKSCLEWVLSTGRDGCLRHLSVDAGGRLSLAQTSKLPTGSWVAGLLRVHTDLVVPAFSGENLQFWNVTEGKVLSQVECGGGHRSWDIVVGSKRLICSGPLEDSWTGDGEARLVYAFLRDGAPLIWETVIPGATQPIIKSGISGREIQCVEPLFLSKGGLALACGGEDTLLHIQLLHKGELHKLSAIKCHLSSIRSMTKIQSLHGEESERELHLISCGGRAQMKVWQLSLTGREESRVSNWLEPAVLAREKGSYMLKAESAQSWKKKTLACEPETRFMDSLAFWLDHGSALLILASSDGYIRFFVYSPDGQFLLIHAQDCVWCLLRLCLVRVKGSVRLAASTTRGSLLLWHLETIIDSIQRQEGAPVSPCFEPSLHQVQDSGLNSLASHEDNMACGGDDGSIHLLKISCGEGTSLLVQTSFTVSLHAAQVSGLVWMDKSRLCSVSIDQRLIVWGLKRDELVPLSVHFSSIPDIQGLTMYRYRKADSQERGERKTSAKLFVYGTGIQVFDFQLE